MQRKASILSVWQDPPLWMTRGWDCEKLTYTGADVKRFLGCCAHTLRLFNRRLGFIPSLNFLRRQILKNNKTPKTGTGGDAATDYLCFPIRLLIFVLQVMQYFLFFPPSHRSSNLYGLLNQKLIKNQIQALMSIAQDGFDFLFFLCCSRRQNKSLACSQLALCIGSKCMRSICMC